MTSSCNVPVTSKNVPRITMFVCWISDTQPINPRGLYSLISKTSYCRMSRSLETTRLGGSIIYRSEIWQASRQQCPSNVASSPINWIHDSIYKYGSMAFLLPPMIQYHIVPWRNLLKNTTHHYAVLAFRKKIRFLPKILRRIWIQFGIISILKCILKRGKIRKY